MRRKSLFTFALSCLALLTGCGGSGPAQVPLGTSTVSLTMHDTPPAGVTVLSFQISVTGATLNPLQAIGSVQTPVSILKMPLDVELTQLLTDSTFLSATNVPEGTYQDIVLTFANPRMTIQNTSGGAIGSCANGATCELTPTLSSASVTYPIALGLSPSSQVGLQVDFDLSQSIQPDFSINPTVRVSQLSTLVGPQGSAGIDQIDTIEGLVTAEQPISQRFGLNTSSGQTLTIYDGNTQYHDFTQWGFINGQTVRMQAMLHADGTLWATDSYLLQDPTEAKAQGLFVGVISSVDSSTQFHMVVHNLLGATSGVQIGNVVTVGIQGGTTFDVATRGLTVPSGLSFASPSDLIAGQEVQVSVASGSSGVDITTDQITLLTSQLNGTISQTAPTGFTLTNLPSLFTSMGNTTISVAVQPETQIGNVPSLSADENVAVCALLFSNAGAPSMVASKVSGQLP